MLGAEHQTINCMVTRCKHNERHVVRNGKTNKVVEVYYTCDKDTIDINRYGKCIHAPKGT